jgi:hypothetical protein
MKVGLGITWLWQLPDTHPFHLAGVEHDRAYEERKHSSSKHADRIFLARCLEIAGSSWWLRGQAYLFYGLVRAWGVVAW